MGGRRSRAGNWPVIALVARRLSLRDAPARPLIARVWWGAALVSAMSSVLLLAGTTSLALVVALAFASMTLMATSALRFFPAAMAVSVIGVALSCTSLMTALSVTSGFEREVIRSMARLNGHVLLTKYGLDFFEYDTLADRWLEDQRVVAASPFAFSMMAVVGGARPPSAGGAQDPFIVSVPEADDDTEAPRPGPSVVVGKGIDPVRAAQMEGLAELFARGDLAGVRPGDSKWLPGIVLGTALARQLDVAVGEFVRVVVPAEIDGHSDSIGAPPRFAVFEVLDVFHTGTQEFDRNLALVHLTAAQSLFFREGRATGIEFTLEDPTIARTLAEEMQAELGPMFRLATWEETNMPLLAGLRQIRSSLWVILGLMTVMAASSLVASLLLIVRGKRHDIAVIVALGGDRSLVFWAFESIGLLTGVCGAGLGVALGCLYAAVIGAYRFPLGGDVYPVDHLPVTLGVGDALGPAAVAVVLCGLAGGPVAALAARIGIIEALRR